MKNIFRTLLTALILLLLGCKDDDDKIKFEGIIARSPDNLTLGTIGSKDLNDWQGDETLSSSIITLMNNIPEQDVSGTTVSEVSFTGGFPNPVSSEFYFQFDLTNGSSLIRYVLVNEKMKVLSSGSFVGTGLKRFSIPVSDESKYPHDTVVRLYYAISKSDGEIFYAGHGDVLICHTSKCSRFSLH